MRAHIFWNCCSHCSKFERSPPNRLVQVSRREPGRGQVVLCSAGLGICVCDLWRVSESKLICIYWRRVSLMTWWSQR